MTERKLSFATALVALAAATMLSVPGIAPAQEGQPRAGQFAQKFGERFKAADKDGDGRLTKAEAEAGMPRLAKNFDEIDADQRGSITQQQAMAWMAKQRQRGGAKTPAPV
ncbi:calcium-binding protein [Caldimonas sp. KR1-144]|uniref:calcium-binding protein n=1 Tax=Caldimonas sp. KR1-144 TaxID=3400911 RepID=UPI003C0EA00B